MTTLQATTPTLPPVVITRIDFSGQKGLNYDDLCLDPEKPIYVTIPTNSNFREGSTITLYWDDVQVDFIELKAEDLITPQVHMKVLPVMINPPTGVVYYETFNRLSNDMQTSFERSVLVNLEVPGNPDPDNTTPINENLSAPEGIPALIEAATAAQGIQAQVAPWLNMEVGDVLKVYWGGTQQFVTNPPLTLDQLNKAQSAFISPAMIAAAGDSARLQVNYDIRDEVNNWSLKSEPFFTNVSVNTKALGQPLILDAPRGNIDLALLDDADVRVQLPAYEGIAEGDVVTVYWLGETQEGVPLPTFSAEHTLLSGEADYPPIILVENSQAVMITGGRARIYYDVLANGERRTSKYVAVTVSGVAAGLAAPTIQGTMGNVLNVSALPEGGATVIIAPYPGKLWGDQVFLTWSGTNGEALWVDKFDVPLADDGNAVQFLVPKLYAEALEGKTLIVSYRVMYFSGVSKNSEIAEFKVVPTADSSLPAPTVDNAPDDRFDPDAHAGTFVRMSSGLRPLDEATLHWGTPEQPGALSNTYRISSEDQLIQWGITAEQVEVFRNQVLDVYYQVNRGGVPLESVVRKLTIATGGVLPAPTLPKPTVNGTVDDVLDPATVGAAASVSVDYDDEMPGDVVTVTWIGAITPPYTTPAKQPEHQSQALQFEVPEYYVNQNEGGAVTVSYAVVRNGSSYSSAPYQLTIKEAVAPTPELSIDTSLMVLNGSFLRLTEHLDILPATWPVGTSQTRIASGGTPGTGYRYQSTAPNIAQVDQAGQVTSRGNGTATITVTDALGASLSYPVTVSGVEGCTSVGKGNFAGVEQAAKAQGGRLPNEAELKALNAMYSTEWDRVAANDFQWSTTKAGIKHYMLNIATGYGQWQASGIIIFHEGLCIKQ